LAMLCPTTSIASLLAKKLLSPRYKLLKILFDNC
jgi:hypothetical protein